MLLLCLDIVWYFRVLYATVVERSVVGVSVGFLSKSDRKRVRPLSTEPIGIIVDVSNRILPDSKFSFRVDIIGFEVVSVKPLHKFSPRFIGR